MYIHIYMYTYNYIYIYIYTYTYIYIYKHVWSLLLAVPRARPRGGLRGGGGPRRLLVE